MCYASQTDKLDTIPHAFPPLPKYDGKPDDCTRCTNKTTRASRVCSECRSDDIERTGEDYF